MAEEQYQSLAVKEMVLGDISTNAGTTPKTGTIGVSGSNLMVYICSAWQPIDVSGGNYFA